MTKRASGVILTLSRGSEMNGKIIWEVPELPEAQRELLAVRQEQEA